LPRDDVGIFVTHLGGGQSGRPGLRRHIGQFRLPATKSDASCPAGIRVAPGCRALFPAVVAPRL